MPLDGTYIPEDKAKKPEEEQPPQQATWHDTAAETAPQEEMARQEIKQSVVQGGDPSAAADKISRGESAAADGPATENERMDTRSAAQTIGMTRTARASESEGGGSGSGGEETAEARKPDKAESSADAAATTGFTSAAGLTAMAAAHATGASLLQGLIDQTKETGLSARHEVSQGQDTSSQQRETPLEARMEAQERKEEMQKDAVFAPARPKPKNS